MSTERRWIRTSREVKPCPDCGQGVPEGLLIYHLRSHRTNPLPLREVLYGLPWPRWWVRRRGWTRIRRHVCPCCYSSPPKPECPVCRGNQQYGPHLSETAERRWRTTWGVLS